MATMFITRSRSLIKSLNTTSFKSISTFTFLSQDPILASDLPPPETPLPPPETPLPPPETPLPANLTSGSDMYSENWRNTGDGVSQSLIPLGFLHQTQFGQLKSMAEKMDLESMMNLFADWMTMQQWDDMKLLFEFWVKCFDKDGKANKPDVNLYNHYLRANLMKRASPAELVDLVAKMGEYGILPNTASFNLVLKSMKESRERDAAVNLLYRMIEMGKEYKEALPDEESYHLVIGMLQNVDNLEAALKFIDLNLKSGYTLSLDVFSNCVWSCARHGKLDTLVSIIERCKKMDQNKALCLNWNLCLRMLDVAMEADNSVLAFYGLEFMAKRMIMGENERPPVHLYVDEGLVISLLGTASRTYNSRLLDASWTILKRSLRHSVPSADTYIAKICAHASLGQLQKAFSALNEFETLHGAKAEEDQLSPFSALHPLVVACSRNGFATLDSVYFRLEGLSKADPPYKSVAALNCIILGCANIWDVDRAYQTFAAISSTFGLTPDINSYNALICAFGKLKKREEALKSYEHLKGLGVKPNALTYTLLVDAHLIARDPKSALSMIDEMVISGFAPTKEILKKVRRRCVRELYNESNVQVEDLAKKFKIRMGVENRRNMLFNLQFSADYA